MTSPDALSGGQIFNYGLVVFHLCLHKPTIVLIGFLKSGSVSSGLRVACRLLNAFMQPAKRFELIIVLSMAIKNRKILKAGSWLLLELGTSKPEKIRFLETLFLGLSRTGYLKT